MGWNTASIEKKRREIMEKVKDTLSKEDLMERVIALETAIYPFVVTLGALNDKEERGTTASSKLFPMLSENEKFLVYQSSTEQGKGGGSIEVERPPDSELHNVPYYEEDSIIITDGPSLDDNFTVLAVHQSAPFAYVGCGSIDMKDIRYAEKVYYNKKEVSDGEC